MNELEKLIERSRSELNATEHLIRHKDYNAAVSRAYYAMFYTAHALMYGRGIKCSSHSGLISTFSQHFIKTGLVPKEMGRLLSGAFEARQSSDYSFTADITHDEAATALKNAALFVNTILRYIESQKQ